MKRLNLYNPYNWEMENEFGFFSLEGLILEFFLNESCTRENLCITCLFSNRRPTSNEIRVQYSLLITNPHEEITTFTV